MSRDRINPLAADWRRELPVLATYNVTLREPTAEDLAAIIGILSGSDATRFGIDEQPDETAVKRLIERAAADRGAGTGFTYVVTTIAGTVGLIQVRQVSPGFQAAEWEMTLAPSARGTGIFLETARLVGSFVFDVLGAHRIEARVLQHNGRAMGALRKLAAVQEGILRRSIRHGGVYFDQVLWSILKEDWSDREPSIPLRVH
jgi:RimJ/RimL family protein N-acetyltransferase